MCYKRDVPVLDFWISWVFFKDDVRDMMLKWRSIGHVPRERMDELADRFRAVCDKILVQLLAVVVNIRAAFPFIRDAPYSFMW